MKNKELFERTINILVDAYQKDTLIHGNCYACAVGNIVAANNNIKFISARWKNKLPSWDNLFTTCDGVQNVFENMLNDLDTMSEIKSTGYDWKDLAKIEFAFETAKNGDNEEDNIINGLLAVYDVLCDIHEVNKKEIKKGEFIFIKETV